MTNFDVIGGIELTVSAAIMIATLSVVMGKGTAARLKVATVLSAWFLLVVVLAATGALHRQSAIGSAGVGVAVAMPIGLMCVALLRVAALRQALERAPLSVLAGVHMVRLLGVSFLVLAAQGRLAGPFAPVAGWGDIFAGLAAVPIAWMVHRQAAGWRGALLAWNVFGLADLAAAISLGVLSSPGPLRLFLAEPGTDLMSTLPWLLVPGFLVPLLATIHLMIFSRLAKTLGAQSTSGASEEARAAFSSIVVR